MNNNVYVAKVVKNSVTIKKIDEKKKKIKVVDKLSEISKKFQLEYNVARSAVSRV